MNKKLYIFFSLTSFAYMLSVSVYLLNSFIMLMILFCGYQNFNDMLFAYIFTVWIKIKNNCKNRRE